MRKERVGEFFLKLRGETYYICWFDRMARQTRTVTTRTDDLAEAKKRLIQHAAQAQGTIGRKASYLAGAELLQPGTADGELLDIDAMLALSEPASGAGVYFLIHARQVVYVGQSVKARWRIREHLREGRFTFDRYLIIPCKRRDLETLERRYIERLSPKYNKARVKARVTVGEMLVEAGVASA